MDTIITSTHSDFYGGAYRTLTNEMRYDKAISMEIVWTGTHTGPLQSPKGPIPATGKKMEIPATAWITLHDGKYREIRHYFDMLGLLTQLGVAPG